MTTDATRNNAEQWHIPPQRTQLGEGMAPLPPQPTVIATHVIDLKPLISWFASELQRERDRVAVERTAASSAREALAACEARLEHARCDAKEAQQMLMDERKRVPWPWPAAGSVEAVLAAYHLLVGHEPAWSRECGWHDESLTEHGDYDAERAILCWLDRNAPGGKL